MRRRKKKKKKRRSSSYAISRMVLEIEISAGKGLAQVHRARWN